MAIVKTGSLQSESYLAFEEQSTFGTALGDAATLIKLHTVTGDIPQFVQSRYIDNTSRRNQGLILADYNDWFNSANNQWQRYQIPQTFAPSDVLASLLYAALQTVSEAVGSPFLKTYTVNGTANPDFSSNEGYFFTMFFVEPNNDKTRKLDTCIMKSLTIGVSPNLGGRMWLSGELISGQAITGGVTPSGTIAYSSVAIPNFNDSTAATLYIDNDLVWYDFQITINNEIAWLGYSSGEAQNYKLVSQRITIKTVVKDDANLDYFDVGDNFTNLTFTIGSAASAGYFKFQSAQDANIVTGVSAIRGGDNDVQKKVLDIECRLDLGTTEYPIFYVVDGIDQTW